MAEVRVLNHRVRAWDNQENPDDIRVAFVRDLFYPKVKGDEIPGYGVGLVFCQAFNFDRRIWCGYPEGGKIPHSFGINRVCAEGLMSDLVFAGIVTTAKVEKPRKPKGKRRASVHG